MICQHRSELDGIKDRADYSRVLEGHCPTCPDALDILDPTPPDTSPYGKCPCCGSCWRADGEHIWVVLEAVQDFKLTTDLGTITPTTGRVDIAAITPVHTTERDAK